VPFGKEMIQKALQAASRERKKMQMRSHCLYSDKHSAVHGTAACTVRAFDSCGGLPC